MEVLLAMELAVMLGLALRFSIGNIERELKREPLGYGNANSNATSLHRPIQSGRLARHCGSAPRSIGHVPHGIRRAFQYKLR
jgi:hypothetical protein